MKSLKILFIILVLSVSGFANEYDWLSSSQYTQGKGYIKVDLKNTTFEAYMKDKYSLSQYEVILSLEGFIDAGKIAEIYASYLQQYIDFEIIDSDTVRLVVWQVEEFMKKKSPLEFTIRLDRDFVDANHYQLQKLVYDINSFQTAKSKYEIYEKRKEEHDSKPVNRLKNFFGF